MHFHYPLSGSFLETKWEQGYQSPAGGGTFWHALQPRPPWEPWAVSPSDSPPWSLEHQAFGGCIFQNPPISSASFSAEGLWSGSCFHSQQRQLKKKVPGKQSREPWGPDGYRRRCSNHSFWLCSDMFSILLWHISLDCRQSDQGKIIAKWPSNIMSALELNDWSDVYIRELGIPWIAMIQFLKICSKL